MKKKNIIILVISILLFILLIVGLIYMVYKNSDLNSNRVALENETEIDVTKKVEENRNTSSSSILNKTYKYNKLNFNIITDGTSYNPYFDTDNSDTNINRNLKTFEISGLKNQEVESEINNEIKAIMASCKEQNYSVDIITKANFSDVLSLEVFITNKDAQNFQYRKIGLNYRLDTGEKLSFSDLFTSTDAAKEVLADSLSERLSQYKNVDANFISQSMQEEYNQMQEANQNELLSFSNGKAYDFSFSSNKLFMYNLGEDGDSENKRNLTISLPDYAQKVVVFSKYVSSDNLYTTENDSNEVQMFTPLNEFGQAKKINDNTYLLQYYGSSTEFYTIDEFDDDMISNMQKLANAELNKIGYNDNQCRLIVQNIYGNINGSNKIIDVMTEEFIVKDEYFDTNNFYLKIANAYIFENVLTVDMDDIYVNSYNKTDNEQQY